MITLSDLYISLRGCTRTPKTAKEDTKIRRREILYRPRLRPAQ